jgi:hypothetical protein
LGRVHDATVWLLLLRALLRLLLVERPEPRVRPLLRLRRLGVVVLLVVVVAVVGLNAVRLLLLVAVAVVVSVGPPHVDDLRAVVLSHYLHLAPSLILHGCDAGGGRLADEEPLLLLLRLRPRDSPIVDDLHRNGLLLLQSLSLRLPRLLLPLLLLRLPPKARDESLLLLLLLSLPLRLLLLQLLRLPGAIHEHRSSLSGSRRCGILFGALPRPIPLQLCFLLALLRQLLY